MKKEFVIDIKDSKAFKGYPENIPIASQAVAMNYIKDLVKAKSFIAVRDAYNVLGVDAPIDSTIFIVTAELANEMQTIRNEKTESWEVHVFGIHYDDWIKALK